jgi:hypothetical protein
MDARITKVVAEMNEETNAISARIDKLIASGSLSDADLAELQAVSDRLKTLGADPADPIPA